MVNLKKILKSSFTLKEKKFPNRVWLASGTCGYGEEIADLIELNQLGGIVIKGTTLQPKEGNPPPRIIETPSGMLNSIGLQNPGIKEVIKSKLSFLAKYKTPVIINISGNTIEEYAELARIINTKKQFMAIEVNISCPNVKKGGMSFGTDPASVQEVISAVKKQSKIPVIAKLSPNVTDITQIALAAESGGADGLSLINTLLGMAFDLRTQKPALANTFGGLSGPAIKPVALRMVYQVRQVTKLPIIGIGGIASLDDVYEFFLAGADAVQLGTINFIDIEMVKKILQITND